MTTLTAWVALFVLFLSVGIGGALWVWQGNDQKSANEKSIVKMPDTVPTPVSVVSVWKDQAGFTFEYYDGVVMDSHDEDTINYAHIELMNKSEPGVISVWAKDTTARDVNAWIAADKTLSTGSTLDTTLAKQPGKKIFLKENEEKIFTATISDAIVFYVEGVFGESPYWKSQYDRIVSSFTFIPLEAAEAKTSGERQEVPVSFDEEEVIEELGP